MSTFKRSGTFYVYILKCNDGTYYTGYTPDLKRRVELHNKGRGAKYTRTRLPAKLVWSKQFGYFKLAFKAEKAVKKLTRAQKDRVVRTGVFPLKKRRRRAGLLSKG
ncbi:MAG: GIY-YIG nuclease family protein [Deltaproteobacteria bacterium]